MSYLPEMTTKDSVAMSNGSSTFSPEQCMQSQQTNTPSPTFTTEQQDFLRYFYRPGGNYMDLFQKFEAFFNITDKSPTIHDNIIKFLLQQSKSPRDKNQHPQTPIPTYDYCWATPPLSPYAQSLEITALSQGHWSAEERAFCAMKLTFHVPIAQIIDSFQRQFSHKKSRSEQETAAEVYIKDSRVIKNQCTKITNARPVLMNRLHRLAAGFDWYPAPLTVVHFRNMGRVERIREARTRATAKKAVSRKMMEFSAEEDRVGEGGWGVFKQE